MASGTATLGMKVARTSRRNTNTTSTTSITEMISVRSTSATEARTVIVRSSAMSSLMPCGIEAFRNGNCSMTRSAVAMMLAPGLAENDDHHAGLAVEAAGNVGVGVGILNVGNIAQAHRSAIAIGNDDGAIVLGLLELVVGANHPALVAALQRALRLVDVLRRDCRAHRLQANVRVCSAGWDWLRCARRAATSRQTYTCPTPSTCASFCERIESAASYIWSCVMASDVSARIRMGESAGLTLR